MVLIALTPADGAPHGAQLAQLPRGIVSRFLGLTPTASNLGIIGSKPLKPVPPRPANAAVKAAGFAHQTYRLGNNLTVYEVLATSASKRDKFLEATRAENRCSATSLTQVPRTHGVFDDLADYRTRRARAAMQRIVTKSGALPFCVEDASGYCIDFLTRKLVAARFLQQNLLECSWSLMSKPRCRA